jgi:hypothetical protein
MDRIPYSDVMVIAQSTDERDEVYKQALNMLDCLNYYAQRAAEGDQRQDTLITITVGLHSLVVPVSGALVTGLYDAITYFVTER